ncbi:MAG: hypothetical protein MZU97_19910 [Bacillus subtilis]|nr:hypothetical protein [Bacillus subtilis]
MVWQDLHLQAGRQGLSLRSSEVGHPMFALCFSLSDGVDHIVVHGCLSGDVYLAGGQSNMQFILKDSAEPEAKANDLLRFYQVPQLPFPNADQEFPTIYAPSEPIWRRCTVDSAMWFSAIGYHVGQSLLQAALDIPIGIVIVQSRRHFGIFLDPGRNVG